MNDNKMIKTVENYIHISLAERIMANWKNYNTTIAIEKADRKLDYNELE